MKLTDEEKKLLRRVCARFHTGIRMRFRLRDKQFGFVACSVSEDNVVTLLKFEHVEDRYNCEPLTEVTPDSIVTAIDLFDVRQVMES